jgi:D-alanyl-D-alanine carboxypeptidase (penicillin-binding protein 5/6)
MEMPDLKAMIENRRDRRQAGAALVLGIGILVMFTYLAPHPKPAPVAAVATSTPPDAFANVPIQAHAAIVYDIPSGQVLYAKNADAQLPLASLTKLITMYAAVKTLPADAPVVITPTAIAQDGDYGLAVGEQFTLENIARFALVGSSNDAAEAVVEAAAAHQSVTDQALLASAISATGLSQTYAVNGTGLDLSTTEAGAYGSAHDVALLASAFLAAAPDLARATIDQSVTVPDSTGALHTLPNTNQDVPHLPRLLLSKTGYTDLAGGNLVVVYDAGINHPVAIAVLGSTEDARFTDVDALVAATEAHFAGTLATAR